MNTLKLTLLLGALAPLCVRAQIQEAWVARYSAGFPQATNRAVP